MFILLLFFIRNNKKTFDISNNFYSYLYYFFNIMNTRKYDQTSIIFDCYYNSNIKYFELSL